MQEVRLGVEYRGSYYGTLDLGSYYRRLRENVSNNHKTRRHPYLSEKWNPTCDVLFFEISKYY